MGKFDGRPVPGQELIETIDHVVVDAIENVCKIGLRVEAVQLRRFDDGHGVRQCFRARVGSGEQPIFPAGPDRAQGALGWYMVKSGLTERVDVSQYRLAAHLTLATFIFAAICWTALGIGRERPRQFGIMGNRAGVLVVLLFIQIALGGFVAGLDAGMGYNTWPLMDGQFIPAGLFIMEPLWRNLFENAMTVQFTHRMTAYFVVLAVIAHWLITPMRRQSDDNARRGLNGLVVAVLAQAMIGIWTLLAQVPIHLGLIHQGGALVVLAFALVHLHYATLSPQMGARVGLSPAADLR